MTALEQASAAWTSHAATAEGQQWCMTVSDAYATARAYLTPVYAVPTRKHSSPEITKAFTILKQANELGALLADALDILRSQFPLVSTDLARYFAALEATEEDDHARAQAIMADLLDRTVNWQRAWASPMRIFEDLTVVTTYTTLFQHLLYASMSEGFPEQFRLFLSASLTAFADEMEGEGLEAQSDAAGPGPGPGPGPSSKRKKAAAPSPHFHRLTVLPRYSTTLLRVAYDEIEKIAQEEAAVGWEEKRLGAARQRLSETVVPWMSGVFETHDNPQSMLRSMYSRFDYYLCRAFFDIRTDELFDIIVDFPDSLAALEDLRECLIRVDQRKVLVEKLQAANLKRLLHPGAETKDVITQYISTIRCLRILDPVGVLLHKVAEPIRRHLRDRSDTIRCIVATLVEGEDLQDENESAEPLSLANDDAAEKFADPKWEPEPIDAAPEFRTGKTADIVGTLVSIYETKEMIVNELQSYLAMRLLAIDDYDSVKEIRTIELLKIRFGEEALHVCDVMLKDMADSKRIDDHVHGDIQSDVHPLIISRMFWPPIPASSFHLTPKLEAAQAKYEAAFHHFKPDKHLRWLQEMGKVSVRLELEDREVAVDVTPLQAAVVELFEGKDRWSEDELMRKLTIDELSLRGALAVWAGHGVLKEDDGAWRLLEVVEEGGEGGDGNRSYVVESTAPAFESVDEARAAKGNMYWTYIRGLLNNLGPQNATTMHRSLGSIKDYDLTVDELTLFLTAAKREGQVQQKSDGSWALM